MNLNNPDLFYSKAFKKIIDKNKIRTKESFSSLNSLNAKTYNK